MKTRLLDLLRCPACGSPLDCHPFATEADPAGAKVGPAYAEDVTEGVLGCKGCPLVYPIIDGVPRVIRNAFAEYTEWFHGHKDRIGSIEGMESVQKELGSVDASRFDKRSNESFSLQWQNYQYGDKTWFKDDLALRKDEFLDAVKLEATDLDGRLVLDAGCGNGRLTASVAKHGAEVVGMDLSRSVVRANERRIEHAGDRAPFVHFVQGNVMEPPFAPETFDHIHTSGVLHHTPSTERAFDGFLKTGKPGGRVYVQLYRKREAWVGLPNRVLRFFTSRLPVKMLYALCYLLAPVHRFLVLCVAKLRGESSPIQDTTRREQAVSLFDNYSPRYQYRYTPDEVQQMFEVRGLTGVRDVTFENEERHMVAFVGDK